MITFSEHLIVTKELNNVVCRYAQKVLLKEFFLDFTFLKNEKGKRKIKPKNINPLLEELSAHQGDIYGDEELEILEFINGFISKLDQNDKTALYFLTLNENYLIYYDDFLANEGAHLDEDSIDKEFGRELAYKIYNPKESELDEDLNELLQNKISSFADDVELSEIDENTIEHILETIESHCNIATSLLIK